MIPKEKSLLYTHPELATEWHPTKNGELTSADVSYGSNKKVWWLGKCGHEWDAVIASRSKGVGCPYCSNRKVLRGFNDLATTSPQLALEWHPTKNNGESPFEVTSGSEKKVWWICEQGHEYEQRIANRGNGQGCPFCKKQILSRRMSEYHIRKSGSLAETNPHLAKEWDYERNGSLLPTDFTEGSNKIVWWMGSCGHEWKASISNRAKGTGCPYCCNLKVLVGFNDLETLYPDIAKEWHPSANGIARPADYVSTSNKKVWWAGKCGHEWEQRISNRTVRKQGCPICAQKLQTSFPEQAFLFYIKKAYPDAVGSYKFQIGSEIELDIYIPSLKTGIEYDGIRWHNDSEALGREKRKYQMCKSRGIKLIRIREKSQTDTLNNCDECLYLHRHPSHSELDITIRLLFSVLSESLCEINVSKDEMSIRGMFMQASFANSFAYMYPELLCEWDYDKNGLLSPYSLDVSSGIYVWWRCSKCGHEWKQRIASRTKGSGCKMCGYEKRTKSRISNRIAKNGSLLENNPSLATEWHPMKNGLLKPSEIMSGSGKKVWWQCRRCGCEWAASVLSRKNGNGCPECAKKKIAEARQKYAVEKSGTLADNNPSLSREWHTLKNGNITPSSLTAGSKFKAWWICPQCGYEWCATVARRNKGHGCPECAKKKRTK